MKKEKKDENLTETQVIEKLTDPDDFEERKQNREDVSHFSETQVIERLTDPDPVQEPVKKDEEDQESDNQSKASAGGEVLSFVRDLIVCMAIVLVITNFVVRPVQVKGSSMYPTLNDSARGFSNVLGYRISGLKRFDIAIIYLPEKDEYLVKRVIGLPGETVSYSNGQLYINGDPVAEPFLNEKYEESYGSAFMEDVAPVKLGKDEYYCLGDNRPHSSDSRYYGPFKKENIISKGIFIMWPLNQFGVESW